MKEIELINASAGSGKTYSLTSRVIEELKEDVAPEALMATTFTNKAAAELRERIRLELLKHERPDEAQRIFDGFLGTINSICARLLKEYALDAGLSPALDVLPEEDGSRLFKIAIARVINEHADAMEPVARRLSRDGGGSGYGKRSDWRDDVQRIVDLARSNNMDNNDLKDFTSRSWESLQNLFGNPCGTEIREQLERAVQQAIEDLKKIQNPKKKTQGSLDELKRISQSMQRRFDIPWMEWVRMSKLGTNKDGEGLLDDVNRIAGEVMRHPDFQADVKQMIYGVFQCAGEALRYYEIFKQKQGLMDFVDQETKVLDLSRNNDVFRASMQDRLQLMMVDEFQDTSPIQLALFLEVSSLSGRSVWVGDPKQAIYGFRGTDPQLMDQATKLLKNTRTLDKSWRSREILVKFTNALFSEVFHWMGKDKVMLHIPDERKDKARGGWIESWNLPVKNNSDEARAIASGISDLLSRRGDFRPGDIAILCRKNDQCEAVSASLETLGIRASVAQGSLLETRECSLAMAALRYMHNRGDRVALAEIVHLSPIHSYHDQWLSSIVAEKNEGMDKWRKDPIIVALDQTREGLNHWTPIEALETAIAKMQMLPTLKCWSNYSMRMSNLDKLRGVCIEYMDQCRANRSPATVAGFIKYLSDLDPAPGQAQGSGEDTVQVLTYHGAKGLEWPIVILTSLDSASKAGAFGADVVAAPVFDPANPLNERSIRFWPWPFGSQRSFPELDNKLAERDEEITAREQAKKESHRLLYVGMTRARDGMVFAIRKHITQKATSLKTAWLDELTDSTGTSLLTWPLETGEQALKIGRISIPVMVNEYSPEEDKGKMGLTDEDNYLRQGIHVREYLPARVSPSSLTVSDDEMAGIKVQMIADFGCRIEIKGNPEMDSLGNAIHGFLAVDHSEFTTQRKLEIAVRLLDRWGVDKAIDSNDLVAAEERLQAFIDKSYPGAKIIREWPITLRNDAFQCMQGWIDMLVELPEGYVVIDHKSYPGTDGEEHAKQYAPQLAVYEEAIEKATGKSVIVKLIHMPVLGKIFDLSEF